MSGNEGRLLYVLSARREMRWQAFKDAFDVLYLRWAAAGEAREQVHIARWHTARMLDALGHCDVAFSQGDGRLYVARPVLARLPASGLPQAILCGARSPETVTAVRGACRALGRAVKLSVEGQGDSLPFAPDRIAVEATSVTVLAELAEKLQVGFADVPPAWGILHFAGSLQEYLRSRDWAQNQEVNWQRHDFDAVSLRFGDNRAGGGGIRLSSYDDPVRNQRRHCLWRGDVSAEVDLDWGRYAVLQHGNQRVLVYDPRKLLLAVPASAPLPRLIARSLALCSGSTPQRVLRPGRAGDPPGRHNFDLFSAVPSDIARLAAGKVGQNLLEDTLVARKKP